MTGFRRGARVRVLNQSSEFRNCLGTVTGYHATLVSVQIDGSGRHNRHPQFFAERALGDTSFEDPADPFVPDEVEQQ